tara:strand:+ start:22346 stop:22669 length:324 start_codon:yes stop_codon:yes gene_type:complete
MAITITDFALEKLKELVAKHDAESFIKISLQGGGCSGFKYSIELVKEIKKLDKKIEFGGLSVLVDKKSYLFLNGMEIDYEETLLRTGIVFNNPNATRTCGCGESISF